MSVMPFLYVTHMYVTDMYVTHMSVIGGSCYVAQGCRVHVYKYCVTHSVHTRITLASRSHHPTETQSKDTHTMHTFAFELKFIEKESGRKCQVKQYHCEEL